MATQVFKYIVYLIGPECNVFFRSDSTYSKAYSDKNHVT